MLAWGRAGCIVSVENFLPSSYCREFLESVDEPFRGHSWPRSSWEFLRMSRVRPPCSRFVIPIFPWVSLECPNCTLGPAGDVAFHPKQIVA